MKSLWSDEDAAQRLAEGGELALRVYTSRLLGQNPDLVLHGGGNNYSAEDRLGIFLHYAPTWLRQEENQYLSCPPNIAKDLDPELRRLMGYAKGGYVLGFFSDPNDTEGRLESVSPEKLFGDSGDKYESLASPDKLVKESS